MEVKTESRLKKRSRPFETIAVCNAGTEIRPTSIIKINTLKKSLKTELINVR